MSGAPVVGRRDLGEFRLNWKPLLACFLGMASGLSINSFIMSNFAPYLLDEFGWTQAQWARMGSVTALIVFLMPVAGYLADRFGVRPVAAVGMVAFPIANLLYSQLTGDIPTYFWIFLFQTILTCTTTATIYTRLVAESFEKWRGIALGICAISPSLVGLFGSPLITWFVQGYGWRNGFLAVAAYSALSGLIALLLIPSATKVEAEATDPESQGALQVLQKLIRQPVFWIFAAGAFLVSAHHAMFTMSLKLVMKEQGVSDLTSAWLIAVFSGSAIAGRIVSGLALDLMKPNRVAAFFLGLPVLGLLLLVSDQDSLAALVLAFGLVGLAYGGEGDIIGYLIARLFGIRVFSTVMGFVTAAIAAAIAGGSWLLGQLLESAGSFDPFLLGAAVCVALGSFLILSLGRYMPEPVGGQVARG